MGISSLSFLFNIDTARDKNLMLENLAGFIINKRMKSENFPSSNRASFKIYRICFSRFLDSRRAFSHFRHKLGA